MGFMQRSDQLTQLKIATDNGLWAYGFNTDVDAAEDVIEQGGDYAGFPVIALDDCEPVELLSSDAADDATGTGARTVRVHGLNDEGDLDTETVTLDGTTPVPTVEEWFRVHRLEVLTAGSGGVNAGTITARHATTEGNVFAVMTIGANVTKMAVATIPRNKVGYVTRRAAMISNIASGGTAVEASTVLQTRSQGGVWLSHRPLVLTNLDGQPVHDVPVGLALPAYTDVRERVAATSATNMDATAEFAIGLVDA